MSTATCALFAKSAWRRLRWSSLGGGTGGARLLIFLRPSDARLLHFLLLPLVFVTSTFSSSPAPEEDDDEYDDDDDDDASAAVCDVIADRVIILCECIKRNLLDLVLIAIPLHSLSLSLSLSLSSSSPTDTSPLLLLVFETLLLSLSCWFLKHSFSLSLLLVFETLLLSLSLAGF